MSVVALLDLATFTAVSRRAPEPGGRGPTAVLAGARLAAGTQADTSADDSDDDDDVWDAETADETPEDLEALIALARAEADPAP